MLNAVLCALCGFVGPQPPIGFGSFGVCEYTSCVHTDDRGRCAHIVESMCTRYYTLRTRVLYSIQFLDISCLRDAGTLGIRCCSMLLDAGRWCSMLLNAAAASNLFLWPVVHIYMPMGIYFCTYWFLVWTDTFSSVRYFSRFRFDYKMVWQKRRRFLINITLHI